MRIKSLAFATTLSLLATSSIVSNVHAQKGMNLQPKTGWAIKTMKENTPDAYCALARRFKQGLILTIAQNSHNETSVALDFGRGDFNTAKEYNIVLDPGAGQQRQYKFKPASQKAFVIRVGKDGRFLSSLNKTGYLRVELDGESYNFNLADIDDGQAKLDACVATSVLPAAGGDTPFVTPAPSFKSSGPQISKLKDEKKSLESRIAVLKKENEQLRSKAKSVPQIASQPDLKAPAALALQKELDALKKKNTALTAEINAFRDGVLSEQKDVSVVALARENQKLQDELTTLKALNDTENYVQQIKTLSLKVSELENENLELSQKSKLALKKQDTSFLKKQILALKNENESLRLNLDSETVAQEQFSELRQEIENLKSSNKKLDGRIATLRSEKDEFSKQLSFYEDENASLKKDVALSGQSSADKNLLSVLRSEIQMMERKNAEKIAQKERQISDLQDKLNSIKTEQARADSHDERKVSVLKDDFELKISALRIKNEALKNELVTLSSENATISDLKDKTQLLGKEKAMLSSSLDQAKQKINILQNELSGFQSARIESLELSENIQKLDKEILNLETRNYELQSQLKNAQNDRKESNASKMDALRAEISELSSFNESLKDKLSQLTEIQKQTSLSAADLKENYLESVNDLKDQNAALSKEISDIRSDRVEQVASLEDIIEKIESENSALKNKLEKTTVSNSEDVLAANKALDLVKVEKDKIIESLKQEIAGLSAEHSAEITTLRNSIEAFEANNKELQASLDVSASKVKAMNNDATNVLADKTEVTSALNLLKADLKIIQQENADLMMAVSNANDFNETLQKDWSKALETIEALRAENAQYEQSFAEATQKSEQQALKIVDLQEKNAALTSQLKEQTREYLELIRQVEQFKAGNGLVQASAEAGQPLNEKELANLRKVNEILEQEVRSLQGLIEKQQQRPSVREASYSVKPKSKPVTKKNADSSESVIKGAPYKSQSNVAKENIEAMKSAAKSIKAVDEVDVAGLANIEPASGSEAEAQAKAGGILDGRPFEEIRQEKLQKEKMEKLNEAQRLENAMQADIQNEAAPEIETVKAPQPIEQEELVPAIDAVTKRLSDSKAEIDETIMNDQVAAIHGSKTMRQVSAQKSNPIASNIYQGDVSIRNILGASGIRLKSDIKTVEKHSDDNQVAYQWMSSNDLFGSAQQKPIENSANFDDYVRDYLTMTEDRCTGDFAIIPAMSSGVGQTRIDSYEIACVGAGVDSSASVVFFSKNGTFTILAHETPTEGMETAMEARDRIVSVVSKS